MIQVLDNYNFSHSTTFHKFHWRKNLPNLVFYLSTIVCGLAAQPDLWNLILTTRENVSHMKICTFWYVQTLRKSFPVIYLSAPHAHAVDDNHELNTFHTIYCILCCCSTGWWQLVSGCGDQLFWFRALSDRHLWVTGRLPCPPDKDTKLI